MNRPAANRHALQRTICAVVITVCGLGIAAAAFGPYWADPLPDGVYAARALMATLGLVSTAVGVAQAVSVALDA